MTISEMHKVVDAQGNALGSILNMRISSVQRCEMKFIFQYLMTKLSSRGLALKWTAIFASSFFPSDNLKDVFRPLL